MRKVVITTDSGCNPRDITNMLPDMIIDSNNTSYYDLKKVDEDSNIKAISNLEVFDRTINGERFHTSSPNINDYVILQKNILDQDKDIVHISTSSGVSSGSVNASMVASSMLNDMYDEKRVSVVDSMTAGSGGTVINDYALDLTASNLSAKEIVEELENVKKRLITTFYVAKVEGFVSSGRAPAGIMLSDKLSLRYRVDINNNGRLFPKLPVFRGNIKVQFMKYLKTIINESNIEEYDPNYLAVLITRLKEINLDEIKNYIDSFNYFKPVSELRFYGAISSYGVEDQVGLGLIKKR